MTEWTMVPDLKSGVVKYPPWVRILLPPLDEKSYKETMTLYFTSDLHFGHQRIIELCNRPFGSVEEMNQTIIDRWNDTVKNDDTVFVLGDVAMGKISDSLPLVKKLKGNKHLVSGNHDRCHR